MEDLSWDKLDCRWSHQLLVVTFKCLTEMAPVYMSSYFTFTHSAHVGTTIAVIRFLDMLPISDIAYLSPMCSHF